MEKTRTVESYMAGNQWQSELEILRKELLKTELVETVKWGMPVYTLDNKNVVGLTGFKKFYGLWFYQGSFLSDPHKLLRNAQEGKTKGMRHLNFTSESNVDLKIVRSYIKEAISNQKAGKMIKPEKKQYAIPEILSKELKSNKALDQAFNALTPGKQKEYKEYLITAKREATKETRLKKIIPLILEGKGMNDKYKK